MDLKSAHLENRTYSYNRSYLALKMNSKGCDINSNRH